MWTSRLWAFVWRCMNRSSVYPPDIVNSSDFFLLQSIATSTGHVFEVDALIGHAQLKGHWDGSTCINRGKGWYQARVVLPWKVWGRWVSYSQHWRPLLQHKPNRCFVREREGVVDSGWVKGMRWCRGTSRGKTRSCVSPPKMVNSSYYPSRSHSKCILDIFLKPETL